MSCFYRSSLLLSLSAPAPRHRDPTRRSRWQEDSGLSGVRGRPGSVWSQPSDHPSVGVSQPESASEQRHPSLSSSQITRTSGTRGDECHWYWPLTMLHLNCIRLKTHSVSPMLKHLFHLLMQELCRGNKRVKNGYLYGNEGRELGAGQIICTSVPAWQPVQLLVNFDKIALSLLVESLDQTDR